MSFILVKHALLSFWKKLKLHSSYGIVRFWTPFRNSLVDVFLKLHSKLLPIHVRLDVFFVTFLRCIFYVRFLDTANPSSFALSNNFQFYYVEWIGWKSLLLSLFSFSPSIQTSESHDCQLLSSLCHPYISNDGHFYFRWDM